MVEVAAIMAQARGYCDLARVFADPPGPWEALRQPTGDGVVTEIELEVGS